MADIIAVLPDAIANQIAAGEVIQRPASVVKELMENSVDSGADKVELIVKDAGRTLIQVIDNGKGMSPADARLCWERHATSKIRKAEDLFSIRSLGFRGEALASIAAVAQVEMRTKQLKSETGTLLIVEGSSFKKQESIASATGTSIAVRNLFYNLPARRNFLRSNAVEFKHIVEEFYRIALPHPDISFVLTHNGNVLHELPPASQKERIAQLLGTGRQEFFEGEETSSFASLHVFLGHPKHAKKTRGEQYFILNGRYIKDAYLGHAISSVYQEYIPAGFFPAYVIFLEISPASVDINVHPTKTEVKFEDERSLYSVLKSVVRKTLAQQHLGQVQESQLFDDYSFAGFLDRESKPEFPSAPKVSVNPGFNPFATDPYREKSKKNLGSWKQLFQSPEEKREEPEKLFPETTVEETKKTQGIFFQQAQLMQVFNAYIVAQNGRELLIIDQEKAHRRILFDKFMENLRTMKSTSQQLLFPRVIAFGNQDALLLEDILEEIRHLGFDVSSFGKGSFIINGLPPEADKAEAKDLLEGFVEEYKSASGLDISDKKEKVARALAKRSAIKKGRALSPAEMFSLVNDLLNCENYSVSPDGKSIFVRFDETGFNKFFS